MNYLIKKMTFFYHFIARWYLEQALNHINPAHEDVPYIVLRIHYHKECEEQALSKV
jgi:hypothetical protein